MPVHKSDRAEYRRTIAKIKKLLGAFSSSAPKSTLSKMAADGLMTSADELERQIQYEEAGLRGLSGGS